MVRPIHRSKTFHQITLSPTGISPLLFGVQQPPISQSGATTSNHGLRVPHLSKRRRDSGQRFGISKRSFEHHKVGSSSQIVRVLLGISAREQAGVTTDLAQDPTLVRRLCLSFPYVYSFLDFRHTPTLLAQTAVMRSTPFYSSRMVRSHAFFLSVLSAVFYQDQSKRKETRMIHFYVCTRCSHNFQDKLLGSEAPIVQTSEGEPSQR